MSGGAHRGFKVSFDDAALTAEMRKAVVGALQECGEDLKARSQTVCPKERGWNDPDSLVNSAEVEVDEEALSMRLRFTAPHAHLQHERRDYKHKPGEQAKFVEQPLDQNRDTYLRKCADAIGGKVR